MTSLARPPGPAPNRSGPSSGYLITTELPLATGPRLVLARHGRTHSNVTRALDSRPPGAPLDDRGRTQAAALAGRLATEPVSAVYASTALRAQQTAEPVARAHGLPVDIVEGVQEVFCGDLEGRSDAESSRQFDQVYRAWWLGDLGARLPGGDSGTDLRARYLPVVERLTAGTAGTVVLVSHGAAIRLAAAALSGDTAETAYIPNTGLVVFARAGQGWALEHWDPAPPARADVARADVTAGGGPSG